MNRKQREAARASVMPWPPASHGKVMAELAKLTAPGLPSGQRGGMIYILHDSWCSRRQRGGGPCNCNPDILSRSHRTN